MPEPYDTLVSASPNYRDVEETARLIQAVADGQTSDAAAIATLQEDVAALEAELPVTSRWIGPFTVGHAQLTVAVNGDPQTIDLYENESAEPLLVSDAYLVVSVAFSGGSIATLDGVVGVGEGDDSIIGGGTPVDMKTTAGGSRLVADQDGFSNFVPPTGVLSITFTPDVAHNLAALTAGACDVYFCAANFPAA